jgi:hypothetical protein
MLALLVLAIFAVGSVSAEENVTTDIDVSTEDVVIDEVDVDDDSVDDVVENEKIVEQTRSTISTYDVNNTFTSSDIESYFDYASESNKVVINFAKQNYSNVALDLTGYSYIELWGNGATLNGDGTHDIFTVTNTNYIVIKDFIINVDSGAAAIYGHHAKHSVYTNNTITGGKDGINIFQVHENLTITDNTISGFTRDGVSLVNFLTMNDDTWEAFISSNISGNKITGGQFAMFFGGNFKGVINNNTIKDSTYAMEFAGKRDASNGKLDAEISNNVITNVTTGISMKHPDVIGLNIHDNTFNTTIPASNYAINVDGNFSKDDFGEIKVINNVLNGLVNIIFRNNTDVAYGNSGIGNYTKP